MLNVDVDASNSGPFSWNQECASGFSSLSILTAWVLLAGLFHGLLLLARSSLSYVMACNSFGRALVISSPSIRCHATAFAESAPANAAILQLYAFAHFTGQNTLPQ
jgi:hypothetical protein